jgi:hypothetical protein
MRLIGFLLVAACFASACSSASSKATPIPASTGISSLSPTVSSPPTGTPTIAVSPTATPARGPQSGVPELDRVVATVLSGSVPAIQALFVETPSPCVVKPQGIHNPPACPDGVAGGTLLPVFRATACESVWPNDYPPTPVSTWAGRPHVVFAVAKGPTELYNWLPASEYAVIFNETGPDGLGSVVFVTGGRITGFGFGCGQSAQQILAQITHQGFLLPPP